MSAWDDPAARIRELEGEVERLQGVVAQAERLADKREQDLIGFTRAAEGASRVGDDPAARWALNIAAIYRADANEIRAALDRR